jgi:hypothetical protein
MFVSFFGDIYQLVNQRPYYSALGVDWRTTVATCDIREIL